jgi:glutamate racemase
MTRPLGIFDSGLGGLSVAREVRALLPEEPIVYLADTAYCPYGGRPIEEIRARSLAIGRELVERGAKVIVVACNTASGAALEAMRAELDVPIVGMEPAVKPAAAATRNGRVGVMATAATLQTDRFERLMRTFARDVAVVSHACPGLVELVERGATEGDEARTVVEAVVEPLRAAQVDTVVLGCTHFPFLRDTIAQTMGPDVRIVESGAAVARQVERVLDERGERAAAASPEAGIELLTTGDVDAVEPIARSLWGAPIPVVSVSVPS